MMASAAMLGIVFRIIKRDVPIMRKSLQGDLEVIPSARPDRPVGIAARLAQLDGRGAYLSAMASIPPQPGQSREIRPDFCPAAVMPKVEMVILWNRSSASHCADPVLLFNKYAD
jgi:hypothetical protein